MTRCRYLSKRQSCGWPSFNIPLCRFLIRTSNLSKKSYLSNTLCSTCFTSMKT
jgi:peptide methionine sulfoxide reductase MsrB